MCIMMLWMAPMTFGSNHIVTYGTPGYCAVFRKLLFIGENIVSRIFAACDSAASMPYKFDDLMDFTWLKIIKQLILQLVCIAVWLFGLMLLFRPQNFLPAAADTAQTDHYIQMPGSGTVMICGSALIFLSMGALLHLVRKNDQPLD
ncbi:uncharacterized protein LOC129593829 [Paramacrobiotus metropolitanus]|uniref:uncharacterized protein LOC129593829 n=1 Tax=Paramacrobiotus metropolitanus TaxID=2943436 RepID=UPI0024463240|nr:uncharacterized protein LOC129593829 [Paramacrobiotus metropolitanus]